MALPSHLVVQRRWCKASVSCKQNAHLGGGFTTVGERLAAACSLARSSLHTGASQARPLAQLARRSHTALSNSAECLRCKQQRAEVAHLLLCLTMSAKPGCCCC